MHHVIPAKAGIQGWTCILDPSWSLPSNDFIEGWDDKLKTKAVFALIPTYETASRHSYLFDFFADLELFLAEAPRTAAGTISEIVVFPTPLLTTFS